MRQLPEPGSSSPVKEEATRNHSAEWWEEKLRKVLDATARPATEDCWAGQAYDFHQGAHPISEYIAFGHRSDTWLMHDPELAALVVAMQPPPVPLPPPTPVVFAGFEEFAFHLKGGAAYWWVSEATTGAGVSSPENSPKEAIADAERRLSEKTPAQLREAIATFRDRNLAAIADTNRSGSPTSELSPPHGSPETPTNKENPA